MKKNASLLITGANGFTGRHACQYFLEQGFHVIPMFQNRAHREIIGNGITCNLTNKSEVMKVMKQIKPDYVLHLAGKNSVIESWTAALEYVEVNVIGTLYLLEAIKQEVPHCRTLVIGSALQADSMSNIKISNPYSLSKTMQVIIAEVWSELMNSNIIIAKPSNLIGPGISNGICSILAKKMITIESNKSEAIIEVNSLKDSRDFLDVRDAVKAYHVLLRDGINGKQYNIGSGIKRSLLDVIEQYKELTQLSFSIKEAEHSGSESNESLVIEDIKRLGWVPEIQFHQSLKDVLEYAKCSEICIQ
ncbi:UDP-2-acetamido-2,6-dideoxy-hexulose 4-reductase [Bacillus wiedmannii]|uniref:UDP-2-acetamido-2,6-dideoxy-hexulose 4-reductase n=1 Tax=Bacillus wiedmannii TaxID=1890302 RepID=A0A2C4LWN1_9BACI|nr:NAD-dependent epimerase/dehydratase family protein [Bacillus wiedmannii]KMP92032.1 UDP-2-acetamido-2,6-dideoxy-hexulose 4-reductase [Bacillus wiedmannii]MCU5518142.1 NAD-dependent epimerase/dehydratase family protein [Bacillus wiedmannii]MCU5707328.1 NAD-dependent epimerase/dehydratase family protein [Bacillus wiedmannii]PEI65749.1 UDP-2-acetamido-2,6-dideoxy-hexulose 4-reductase [Bacillus wiedmannii]PEJ71265.1 UDP-2-acetamido-2,6-dideoxy-hexulose 4-reductase [Bacillus wiedmannii]